MVNTTTALSQEERLLVLKGAVEGTWNYDSFPTLDPRQLILAFWSIGFHPEVLQDTGKWGLRIEHDERGLAAKWNRPKNRRSVAVPLYWQLLFEEKNPLVDQRMRSVWPDVQPWIEDWLTHWIERSRQVIFQDVRRWGIQAGVPRLSPRVLRHDFIARCYETTHDVNLTMALAGASLSITMDYARPESVMQWFRAKA